MIYFFTFRDRPLFYCVSIVAMDFHYIRKRVKYKLNKGKRTGAMICFYFYLLRKPHDHADAKGAVRLYEGS